MGYCFLLDFNLLTNHVPDSHLLDVHADDGQASSRRIADKLFMMTVLLMQVFGCYLHFCWENCHRHLFDGLCPYWYKI